MIIPNLPGRIIQKPKPPVDVVQARRVLDRNALGAAEHCEEVSKERGRFPIE